HKSNVLMAFTIVPVRLQSSQPVSAARLPCRVKVSAGRRYAWCACGHSKKQPFCDGAHKASAPDISPLRFTPDKDQTVLLCACKQTKNAPYCDGSHFKNSTFFQNPAIFLKLFHKIFPN
uniref:Iron-binding zinc finger CDGSH type domain-containing protein n=1 Tax=Gouania willdenowi TaxID=441366 RepID=A0A8C5D8H3_GOUWI